MPPTSVRSIGASPPGTPPPHHPYNEPGAAFDGPLVGDPVSAELGQREMPSLGKGPHVGAALAHLDRGTGRVHGALSAGESPPVANRLALGLSGGEEGGSELEFG